MHVVAVVLAGGTDTRLYPASRPDQPKQFRSFGGDAALLSQTVERTAFADETVVLTRPDLADRARELLPNATVLAEPAGKDTGPALAYAAHELRDRADVCCCLPSDHHVAGDFGTAMGRASRVAAETGSLVTVGVEPTRAAIEYGYVEPGEERTLADGTPYRAVETFVEKPDPGAASRYRQHGYLWNAGIFAWTPGAFLSAARDSPLAPLLDELDAGDPAAGFEVVASVSVDYAVLERAESVAVVPADFEWADLGAWDALARAREADDRGNVTLGDPLVLDSDGSVVAEGEGMELSVVGVEDVVVAAYDGRVVVAPKHDAQRVREVAECRASEDGAAED
jgi:mannose-1-phosphate guanylyltransferase